MTPIEKNIRVVDEQGNEYEATYPKRAKGLVKNGRARFIDENTICLACPPDTMEVIMSNITLKEAWIVSLLHRISWKAWINFFSRCNA